MNSIAFNVFSILLHSNGLDNCNLLNKYSITLDEFYLVIILIVDAYISYVASEI